MKYKLFFTTVLLFIAFSFSPKTIHADTETDQLLTEYYECLSNKYASFDRSFEEFSANYYQRSYHDEQPLEDYLHSANEQYLQVEAERLANIPPMFIHAKNGSLSIR